MLFSHVCNTRNITGAEKLLFFIARKLSAHFECTIVAPNEGRLTQLARGSELRVIIMETPMIYGMCFPYENLIQDVEDMGSNHATAKMVALLKEENPDYVFVNTCVNVIPAMAAKHLGIPVIWHITEIVQNNGFINNSVWIINKYSDWILGISESTLAPFKDSPMEEKLSLLYPSWESGEFQPAHWPKLRRRKRWEWGINPRQKVIGYISSFLVKDKGPEHFVKTAISIGKQYPESRFVIIGAKVDRSFYRSLKQSAKDAGLSKHFIFIECELSIEAAYCAMDIVIVPSLLNEGFGMTAMEAMIFGKPVVAYASGGLKEILESTGSGDYLAPTGDIEVLTAKVSGLLQSTDMMEKVGLENQIQVEAKFGSSVYEDRFMQFVECIYQLKGNQIPLTVVQLLPTKHDIASPGIATRKKRGRERRIRITKKRLRRRHSGKRRVVHARKSSHKKLIRRSEKLARSRKQVRRRSNSTRQGVRI
ncbi:glycosyltransferase family 4 protein [Paenibacillus segetis]|nr:glycosyltransferase family 4 protein [Paenibacillus segetis]